MLDTGCKENKYPLDYSLPTTHLPLSTYPLFFITRHICSTMASIINASPI